MERLRAIIFFVFFILTPWAYAMSFAVQEDSLVYTISVLNSKEQLTSEQVVSGKYDSDFTQSNTKAKFDINKLIWLRIDLKNETQYSDWVLNIDPSIPYATVYDNGNVKRTGAHVPFNSKDVGTDDNVVRLTIKEGQSRSIYLKIEDHRGMSKIPILTFIHWKNWQTDKYKKWSRINLVTGFYIGSTLLLSIALLFFYTSTKDFTYFVLGMYLICSILFEMGEQGYYWFIIGEIPHLFWIIKSMFLAGFYIGFYQFLRSYFDLKRVAPFWDKVLTGIILMFVIWFILRVFFPDRELIRSIIIICSALSTIIFFIKLLLAKNPIVYFVFWGSIAFFTMLIIAILLYTFNATFINHTIIIKLGIILQVILYSLGLAHKVKLINENLENLVQERTDKITNQNQKLIDYAFRNAHNIRGPLARILGLVNLITIENKDTNTDYVSRLSDSSKELDSSIRTMSKLLEDEDLIDDGTIVEPPN